MKRLILAGLLALIAGALMIGPASGSDDDDDGRGSKRWLVTIQNLTPPGPGAPGSQPLSPPLFVVHSKRADVWSAGEIASHPVAAIAEDTNDAFTGLDSYRARGGGAVLLRMAHDAGSERNNELKAFIPGPCCGNAFVRDPEGALIQPHEGIAGVGELDPAVYGWKGPVAQ